MRDFEYEQLEIGNLEGIDMFHFEEESVSFNDIARDNGFTYWFAHDFMTMLGYETRESFWKVINKAIATCMTLDIDTIDNFEQCKREVEGKEIRDFKLSRFACYLIAMQADGKKPQVAKAQAFFAASAEVIRRFVDSAEDVERVYVREDISTHEKSLSGVAKQVGVDNYAFFQNAGYRGMYNMNLKRLKQYKGLETPRRSLLDFMQRDELAANLFRLTQTELRLKKDGVQGQSNAEATAELVGRKVRKTMIELGGVAPEDMELGEDIRKIRSGLKATHKGLKKIDEL